jgi:hypothetical protein
VRGIKTTLINNGLCNTRNKIYKLLIYIVLWMIPSFSAHGFDFIEKTHVIEIRQGSELSEKVNFYTVGGFEAANGSFVSYTPWYVNHWTDTRVSFMTQITETLGIIWGVSSGEVGDKYRIYPSLKIGVAYFENLSKNSTLSFKVTTILSGNLTEYPCIADYGDVGGVQMVNCRMAASQLPPSETLNYLFNDRPYNQTMVTLEYKLYF